LIQDKCADPAHKGHSYFVGGVMHGHVHHHIHAHSSDYPMMFGTVLRNNTRSWYEIDYAQSDGAEVVYICVGQGKFYPARPLRH
jgi:UDP-2,3-diacylglucosamine pyrophosphatase LpxH